MPALTSVKGHGTLVAGVIGAVGNNSIGVAGVCWDVSLVSLQICDSQLKSTVGRVAEAIVYATVNNIPILNMSTYHDYMVDSFQVALCSYDGIIICAAGNDSLELEPNSITGMRYPSIIESAKIISVASIDLNNNLANTSNYGEKVVELAAPGDGVWTTYDGAYIYGGGTSLAAPYVTGVVALIKSEHPDITNYGIRKAILSSVDKKSSLNKKVKTGGKLNAYAALQAVGDIDFTVVYDANGGSGTMESTSVTYGFWSRLNDMSYTKPLHNFVGWDACRASDNKHRYEHADGTQRWFVEGTESSGYSKKFYNNRDYVAHTSESNGDVITMPAQWEPYKYTIVFEGNGASSVMYDKECEYNVNVTLPDMVYEYDDYVFDCWKVYKYLSDSSKVWLYINGESYNWYTENNQPSNYVIA